MFSSIRVVVLTLTLMFIIHFKITFTWYVLIVKIVIIYLIIIIDLWTVSPPPTVEKTYSYSTDSSFSL